MWLRVARAYDQFQGLTPMDLASRLRLTDNCRCTYLFVKTNSHNRPVLLDMQIKLVIYVQSGC